MTQQEANKITQFIQTLVGEYTAGSSTAEVEGKTVSNTAMCNEHGIEMESRISKKTGKPYLSHFEKDGDSWRTCFGKGWQ